ncbi:MAG: hypothetical protein LBS91_08205 [Clostridiales Family XIII bacterium]|jgi:hypothetical protein|nr:hypothetical protein [Clostridiales Family XIII bacterium]
MSYANLFVFTSDGNPPKTPFQPADAIVQAAWRDARQIPDCLFNEVFWIVKDCENPAFVKYKSDEVLAFISGDFGDPDHLKATIEFWIENDKITITDTSFVFVPAGAAHGKIKVTGVTRPIFCTRAQFSPGIQTAILAEASAAPSTYSHATSVVEKYVRADGTLPNVPQGFLKLLLWLDGAKLKGAPYMESVWFCTTKEREEDAHDHDFDEFLACVGSDPERPGELGAEMHFFVEDEEFVMDKSFLLFLPKGVRHCPMFVTKMERPFLHFTGGRPSVENYSGGPRS